MFQLESASINPHLQGCFTISWSNVSISNNSFASLTIQTQILQFRNLDLDLDLDLDLGVKNCILFRFSFVCNCYFGEEILFLAIILCQTRRHYKHI